jgi:hypothetical protein
MIIKLRIGRNGHDEVNFTVWMAVMWSLDVGHINNIDAVAMQVRCGLYHPPVSNSAGLVFAHPTGLNGHLARLEEGTVQVADWRETLIQIVLQGLVE